MYSRLSSFTKLTVVARFPLQMANGSSAFTIRWFGETVDVSSGMVAKLPIGKLQAERRRESMKRTQGEHNRIKGESSASSLVERDSKHFLSLATKEGPVNASTINQSTPHSSRGVISYPDGGVYEGELLNNKQHSRGKYVSPNKESFDGIWVNGKKHGQGKQTSADGRVLEGEWKDGLMYNGKGVLVLPNGAIYEGTWIKGRMEGQGKITTKDSHVLEGDWKDGKITTAKVCVYILMALYMRVNG